MAEKYSTILRLAAETEKNVTADGQEWFRFMDCAGRFSRYPFRDQLLIYAQRPDARACASIKVWDSMGCWISRGAKGIALIDTEAPRPRLKYVFDMADVKPEKEKNGHLPEIWSVKPEHEQAVMEALEASYGKTDAQYPFGDRLAGIVIEDAKGRYKKAADRIVPHIGGSLLEGRERSKIEIEVFDALVTSAICQAVSASGTGHHPAGYFFSSILKFNTPKVLHLLGEEINSLVRPIVAQMGRAVREYEKEKASESSLQEHGEEKNASLGKKILADVPQKEYNALKRESDVQNTGNETMDKERGVLYGTGIQTGRGLPAAGYRDGYAAARGAAEVRPAAERLPDGKPGGRVYDASVRKRADEPLAGSPGAGGGADGADHEADGRESGSGRSAQGTGPDAVGAENEQHPAHGRGNRPGGDDLYLDKGRKAEKKEKEPDNGQTPLSGSFQENQQDSMGGAYEQMTLFDMLSMQEGGPARHPLAGQNTHFTSYKVPEEQIDDILRSGGGRDGSRARIYAKYQQGKTPEEMTAFLRKEYGTTGKGFTFGSEKAAVWFQEDGMRIGRGVSALENTVLFMDWSGIEKNIREQVENGTYMDASEAYLVDEAERSRIAGQLFHFFRDGMGELPEGLGLKYHNCPDSYAILMELMTAPEGIRLLAGHMDKALQQLASGERTLQWRTRTVKEELRAELDNLMVEKQVFLLAESVEIRREDFITQEEIEYRLAGGNHVVNGKFRIYDFFKESPASKDAASFLKKEYGIGGSTLALPGSDHSSENYGSRGIMIEKGSFMNPHAQVLLSWREAEKCIRKLVSEDRYLYQKEKGAYEEYRKKQEQKALEKRQAEAELKIKESCRDAIGQALHGKAAGGEFAETDVAGLVEEYGAERVSYVLAVSAAHLRRDGHPCQANSEWVDHAMPYALDETRGLAVPCSPDVLDAFISRSRDYIQKGQENSHPDSVGQPEQKAAYQNMQPDSDASGAAAFHQRNSVNFHITDDALGTGGPKEKFQRNMEAVRTLAKIESENRPATLAEQHILSKYVGWGGLADAFDESKNKWAGEYQELKSILSEEEYISARESVLNAHYTSPVVIRSIYSTLERMGFEKGTVLEPSMGIGNFFGMLPEKMQESRLYGVELDSITGRIAKQLYPDADIQITGFEKTGFQNDFFDLAVGNVPFGQYQLADRQYDKFHFPVHEYFFAKALDKIRPGGVAVFITSRWLMDKKNPETRKYLAQRAELLGAVRLPDTAFKDNAGTEVTADILFFQKLDRMAVKEPEWVHLSENADGISMNQYFISNPQMVVGKMEMVSGPYGMEGTCRPDTSRPFADQLAEAALQISGRISLPEHESVNEAAAAVPAEPGVKNFSYTIVDGRVYYRENSIMVPSQVPETTEKRIRGMMQIRDCTQELIQMQMEECQDSALKEKQGELNALYDSFTGTYGLLNDQGNRRAFGQDASYCLLCSLEKLDAQGNLKGKADMFSKRTIKRAEPVTGVDTAAEALAVSLSEKAGVDLEYMSALCGKEISEVTKELSGVIFQNPVTGEWENGDAYLSGNVRAKLKTAVIYAESHPEYAVNVQALRQVQPKELEAGEIDVRIGATWIEPRYIDDFMKDVLRTPRYFIERGRIRTKYSPVTGKWNITGKNEDYGNALASVTYGTDRVNAYKILEDSLNLKEVRVFDLITDEEGREKRVLNKQETMLAGQKQEALRDAFRGWIFEEQGRRQALCEKYNQMFNSTRPREYDGSHLKFPGMSPDIELRPHQLNAVAHQLYGANTLLAHCVGAGKTFEMIAAAMEERRLGLSQKCLFVVPNHLTGQWAADFLRLYPGANILAAGKKDFEPANRKKFCSRIATGEYDAVIIGHSQFEKIPLSVERQAEMINRQTGEIEAAIREIQAEKGERYTIKQMEKTKKSLSVRLERLHDAEKKDHVVTFEELGVDRLFVDESHNYKNLFLYTKMRNVAGISQSEAQKSSDMFAKCQYLDELTGGRGITFATGTPISNSMTEMYTNMRYLQHHTLQKMGLGIFDAWASTFGETVTSVELAPEGTGYRTKTRFSRFYNLPELMAVFKECADIQTAEMLNLPVPEAQYENVVLKPSDCQKEMIQSLVKRAEDVRSGRVEPDQDNMLRVTNDGRKLALDQRLLNGMLPDNENSKAAACVKIAFQIWESTKEQRSAQLIFCDLSTPKGDGAFNVYEDIRSRLIEKGVPEHEIAFIHAANTDTKKENLFANVRSGQVRFLLGSTQKMGAGTNVQERLVALHHLDVPWRPADVGRILRTFKIKKNVEVTDNGKDDF